MRMPCGPGAGDVAVVGAGVAGLATAVTLAERGFGVTLHERAGALGDGAASWLAGGMLAPFCEAERADAAIVAPGLAGIDWWAARVPGVERRGTLVVAAGRDAGEIERFYHRTRGSARLDENGIAKLEPSLAGRFHAGLFFPDEAHLDPRKAMAALAARLTRLGGTIRFDAPVEPEALGSPCVDCRGMAARPALEDLRPVRGEMLILRAPEVTLSRPVRLLHPRLPLYVVPRGEGVFMVGASEIETGSVGAVTLRSAVELMNAAYGLDPRFAEAEVLEMRAGLRPAFPDNLPRALADRGVVRVNGLYRHGFLLSPALSVQAADLIAAGMGRRSAA